MYGLTGEKRQRSTCPVWHLCSQCRAGFRLLHLLSSPISTAAVCHSSRNSKQNVVTANPQRLGDHLQVANRAKPGLLLFICCCYLGQPDSALLQVLSHIPLFHRCSCSAGPKYKLSSGSGRTTLYSGACLCPCIALMTESKFESKPFESLPQ